ncbi:MAG: hypothetical protein K0R36_162 [Chryseobacterium sp.]|jgi:hypothetical protein|nr:hypothetical protein [Chryseobacterium sp.]
MFCFSCSKNLEERCFIQENEKYFNGFQIEEPFNIKEIIKNKPDYLEITKLKKYRSFKIDSIELRNTRYDLQKSERYWKDHDSIYSDFNDKFFNQFEYSFKQISGNSKYALGRNRLGYWLLEIKNEKASAYFLGLSFSHYYFNKIQGSPIVQDRFLRLEGSLVKIVKVPGLPGYDDYSALDDGKLFEIKLEDLIKDSDHDGFNDIFENSFGLNPNNKDTDGDGIHDFKDHNPLYKSEKNKFTSLYVNLINQHLGGIKENLYKMNYFFLPYKTDCDYFQQIDFEAKVLMMPTKKSVQPYYVQVTDIFNGGYSKIEKDDKNPNLFYIYESNNSGVTNYSAEFKNGVWFLKNIGGTIS